MDNYLLQICYKDIREMITIRDVLSIGVDSSARVLIYVVDVYTFVVPLENIEGYNFRKM